MANQVVTTKPKKKSKSQNLYCCTKCSYQTNRAYNVQRHLVQHFEVPPKELQHLCPYVDCSFATLRWDNLNRHMQRLHGVIKSTTEDTAKATANEQPQNMPSDEDSESTLYVEELDSCDQELDSCDQEFDSCDQELDSCDQELEIMCDENPESVANDDQPATLTMDTEEPESSRNDEEADTLPSDEELWYLSSGEDSAALTHDDIPARPPVVEQPKTTQKVNKESKVKKKIVGKTKKSNKSGKIKLYECNTCGYRTNRGYNIKRHLAKHIDAPSEGLLLHVCIISGCGFATPRWDNLCRHVKRVHPSPPDEC